MKTRIPQLALLCALFAAPAVTRAGDEQRPRRAPPQEAVDACARLAVDQACRFTFDGRDHEGLCRRGPDGQGPLACAPNRGSGHGGQGAPASDRGPGQGHAKP